MRLGLLVMTMALAFGFVLQASPLRAQGGHSPPSSPPSAARIDDRIDARPHLAGLAGLARATLYPGFDEATRLTGEAFRSPSLERDAANMSLAEFVIEPVAGSSDTVAAALLKPVDFPPFYTLLEVALLRGGPGLGLELRDNLKVRVDTGSGSGVMQIRLARVERPETGVTTFQVVVSGDGQALAHHFTHRGTRLALVASEWAQ